MAEGSRRIVLATGGSLGDLHPVIALGKALAMRGFQAEIASARDYRAKVEAEGLVFHEVGPDLAQLEADLGLDIAQLTDRIARSDRFLFEEVMLPYTASSTRQMIAASEGAGLIVGLSFAVGAAIAAERLGLPHVAVSLQPTTVFSAYDPPFLPRIPWMRPAGGGFQLWLNWTTLAIGRRTTASWTRRINRIRRDLGVGPAPGDIFFDALAGADLALGLYSPALGERQPDARPAFHVVGYAPYDSEAGGPPLLPEALRRFLDKGEAPIVFTLGSAVVNIPGDFYRQSLKAARALGRRSVLLVGSGGDLGVADGSDAIAVPYAPFSLLFPRAAAVVHQGGVGTTQQALRAGRPQLVVPHLGDQHDNAARVQRLGCGLTLSRGRYAARAEVALSRLLGEPNFGLRADVLGARTRDEDGASVAAGLIAEMMG